MSEQCQAEVAHGADCAYVPVYRATARHGAERLSCGVHLAENVAELMQREDRDKEIRVEPFG